MQRRMVAGLSVVLAGWLAAGTASAAVPSPVPGFVANVAAPVPERVIYHVVAGVNGGGDGSAQKPFDSIEAAVSVAKAGDVVVVHRGTYRSPFTTKRGGRESAPIRIVGGGAKLVGPGEGRFVQVFHDYVSLENLDISNADSLIWVQGATGVQVLNNTLHDAQGECVRIKYFSKYAEVAGNRITRCGEKGFSVAAGKKNGEGVYIGTAPEQLYKNPTQDRDQSSNNWVHDNIITTRAECVDVKEGAANNLVTRNHCSGSEDPEGAGFSSRGKLTIFRDNTSINGAGAGIRLGGDADDDGILSLVRGNILKGNKGFGVKVQRTPQREICGNTVADNGDGATNGTTDPASSC